MDGKALIAFGVLACLLLTPPLRGANPLRDKLDREIETPEIEANTPIREALVFFGDRCDITIVLDEKAFEAVKIRKVAERPVRLAALKNVRLRAVLETLARQIGGTCIILPDRIEIVPHRE